MTFKTVVTEASVVQGLTDFLRLAMLTYNIKQLKRMEFSLLDSETVVLQGYEGFVNAHVFFLS